MKKLLSKDNMVIIGLIVFAVIGAFLALHILPAFPVISDSLDYDVIAQNILTQHQYTEISVDKIIYPPLYPLFLSLIYAIFGHTYKAVYFIQFLLVGITAGIFYKIYTKFFHLPVKLSILACLFIIAWPYMILYSLLISSEILYITFLSFSLYFFLNFLEDPSYKHTALTAATLSYAVLTRPVALLLPLWIAIGIVLLQRLRLWQSSDIPLSRYIAIFGVFILLLLPWIGYIYVTFDRIIPVASNLSYVFNKANTSFEYLKKDTAETTPKQKWPETHTLSQFIGAKITNMYLFWNPDADGYNIDILISKHQQAQWGIILYKIMFFLIIIFGLGSVGMIRHKEVLTVPLLIVSYFWAVHTVLFPSPRYTLPIIPIMIALAFYSLHTILTKQPWFQKS